MTRLHSNADFKIIIAATDAGSFAITFKLGASRLQHPQGKILTHTKLFASFSGFFCFVSFWKDYHQTHIKWKQKKFAQFIFFCVVSVLFFYISQLTRKCDGKFSVLSGSRCTINVLFPQNIMNMKRTEHKEKVFHFSVFHYRRFYLKNIISISLTHGWNEQMIIFTSLFSCWELIGSNRRSNFQHLREQKNRTDWSLNSISGLPLRFWREYLVHVF